MRSVYILSLSVDIAARGQLQPALEKVEGTLGPVGNPSSSEPPGCDQLPCPSALVRAAWSTSSMVPTG